ncbi:MAG: hypothetical protein KF893_09455 [Caldilineaceae bacterium]|nr:hypothetical protein [Caldilineaceae bacterium]
MTAQVSRLWGLLAVALLVGLLSAWIVLADHFPPLRGPAPWPPSWRWLHLPIGFDAPLRLGVHALILFGYGVLLFWLTRPSAPARTRVTLLTAAIFVVLWQLIQSWVREPNLLDTLIFRTYAPPLNGYFLAPAQVESIGDTLRNYAAAMPDFFGDKPQTHPPGLFLYYAFFQEIFARLPAITGWFAPIARGWAIPGQDWPQLADHLITSAFVTTVIQTALIGLTPPALYAFLRQLRSPDDERSRTIALWAALLTPLIPALTLFFLQWDTLFPALGFAAWFFALRGQNRLAQVESEGWGQWLDWLWAGLILSLLTWLSFGTLVFGLMIGLHVLWREGVAFLENRNRFDPLLMLPIVGGLTLMGAGVVVPWLTAYAIWGMNFFELMRAGLAAHYEIVTAHRDYATWVWMNIVDFVLWPGPALILLGMAGSGWLLVGGWRLRPWRDWAGMALIVWFVFLLLDLSGTTRGEIGRLWIFLMPFPLLFALILPWTRGQRLILIALLIGWGWVITYTIPPFLCC